jgi:truncated hemoglobin YjbI
MFNKIKLIAVLILLSTLSLSAQTKDEKPKISEELKKSTIELLRETSQDVLKMQSRSNRIIYSTEVADLIWEYDEKEARSLYLTAINEIRQSLAQLEADAALPENSKMESVSANTAMYAANAVISASNSNVEPSNYPAKQVKRLDYQLTRKFDIVLRFRQKLILSLAENDPVMADEFLRETKQIVTEEQFKEKITRQDKGLEDKIALAIGKKDPNKALEAGRKMLSENKLAGMSAYIERFYKIDADKAVTLADEYAKKLETSDADSFRSTIEFVKVNENINRDKDKKPLLSESRVKSLVDSAARQILAVKDYPNKYQIVEMLFTIEKYAPLRAKQIRQKFAKDEQFKAYNYTMEEAGTAMKTAGEVAAATQNSKEEIEKERVRNKLGKEKLTDDEKKKILEDFRSNMLSTNKTEKMMMTMQAVQMLAKSGENELALSLLTESNLSAPIQVENAKDAMLSWSFASLYSSIEPKKSFDLLETTIPVLNDNLEAFVKLIRFIEPERDEIVENGELKMAEGGGGPDGGFAKSMLRSLQGKEETMRNLAKADFARTRDLAYKFSRSEVQIELKLMIIKSLLEKSDDEYTPDYGMRDYDEGY